MFYVIETFLKSLDLPYNPCEGIFHGPSLLEIMGVRTGVLNDDYAIQKKNLKSLLQVNK